MTDDTDKQTLSDELLADTDRMEKMELERRQLTPGSPEFLELSVDERHVGEDITRKASTAAELTRAPGTKREMEDEVT